MCVDGQVAGDPIQPGSNVRPGGQPAVRPKRAEEGLLVEIGRLARVRRETPQEAVDLRPVAFEGCLERGWRGRLRLGRGLSRPPGSGPLG